MTTPKFPANTQFFVNAKVFTGVGEHDFATAFAVSDGAFVWVGEQQDVSASITERVDLGGRTVVPGFLDVHTHPSYMAQLVDGVQLLPPDVLSLEAMLDRLREHPHLGKGDHLWIEGFGFDENKYPEGRKPTAHDLDLISLTQPMLVRRCDGHTAVCNSRALELAGITKDTPDPEGAKFGRFDDGTPNGILIESGAISVVERLRPPLGRAELAHRLLRLEEHFLSRGIVGVCDLLATTIPEPLETYREAESRGLRVASGLYYAWADLTDEQKATGLADDERTGRQRIAGLKVFMDGAYSDRNAWTEDPYPGSCSHGLRITSDDEMRAAVAWAKQNRVQVAFHAMGDRALNHVVDMFGDEEPWMGTVPSIRLDHSTLFSEEMLDRLTAARMEFAVVSHTIFLFAEYDSYEHSLSPAQFEIAYPIRSFYERVSATALASDNPATAWADADNVFVSVKAAVTRRAYNGADIGAAEAVTIAQALMLYTGRAAQVSPLQDLGVIAPGYDGTFVVLDRDVFTTSSDELDRVEVSETWVRGELGYRSP